MVLVVVVGVNDQLSCFDGQQTECRRVVCSVLCVVTIIIKIEISTLAAEVVLALLATVMRMGGRERGRGRGQ